MKWILILILITTIALLGCSPAAKDTKEPVQKPAGDVTFDDAMGSNVDTSKWITDYTKALELAKSLNRPVLINFTGSDWCGWCKKLAKEVFVEDEFLSYAKENLILLKLDFPKSIPQTPEEKATNDKLAKQYGIEGFPTIVLLGSDGTELNRLGYEPGGAANYISSIKKALAAKK